GTRNTSASTAKKSRKSAVRACGCVCFCSCVFCAFSHLTPIEDRSESRKDQLSEIRHILSHICLNSLQKLLLVRHRDANDQFKNVGTWVCNIGCTLIFVCCCGSVCSV